MDIYTKAIEQIGKTDTLLRNLRRCSYVKSDAKALLKECGGGYNGSQIEYEEIVLRYWRQYGKRPEKYWYDLYCNADGRYDPRFIPDTIWFTDILPHYNNIKLARAYNDKGMFDVFLRDVKMPDTIVRNIGGYFYDSDKNVISLYEALRICSKEQKIIIKPSFGQQGKGIVFIDGEEPAIMKVKTLDAFNSFGSSFVVQKIVTQHQELAAINDESLNTVRVLSFHFNDAVYILSAQLRIGGAGSRVDNYSSGGFACAVDTSGLLADEGINKRVGWVKSTDKGFVFKGFSVPFFTKIVDAVNRLHEQMPYFNIIGWDFAVDAKEDPVLIEFNTGPAQNQLGGKSPTFGDMTEEVLEDVFVTHRKVDVK